VTIPRKRIFETSFEPELKGDHPMPQKLLFERLFLSPEGGRMYSWLSTIVVAVCVIGCVAAIIKGNILMFVLGAAAGVIVWLTCRALRTIVAGRPTLPPPPN
jgi:hypothetical protein